MTVTAVLETIGVVMETFKAGGSVALPFADLSKTFDLSSIISGLILRLPRPFSGDCEIFGPLGDLLLFVDDTTIYTSRGTPKEARLGTLLKFS